MDDGKWTRDQAEQTPQRGPFSVPHQATAITVVGAGLIGASIAFALARAGYRVCVYDADLPGAAWRAGAGMLTPDGEGLHSGPLASIARASLGLWPQFARDLEAHSGVAVHFREGVERLQANGSRQMTPGEAQVHPPSVVQATLTGLEVRRERLSPASIVQHPSPIVLATGAWSADFSLPVFPVQGQALLLDARHGAPALFGRRRRGSGAKGYTLCRPDGVYVGATVRQSDRPDPDPHAEQWLRGMTRRLLPELADAPLRQVLVGLRPCTPGGLPIVGPHPTLPNVFVATGHGRHGALLAPWTAREAVEWARGYGP